jgi:hypothetical protein
VRIMEGRISAMEFRLTSDSLEFPYGSDLVPFILFKAGKMSYVKSRRDKLDMLSERGGKILAVWPGKWSSDVFVLDNRSLAKRVLQQGKYASLADLEYMDHHEGLHRAKASPTCKQCREHLNGDHAKPPFASTYCQNNGCPINSAG